MTTRILKRIILLTITIFITFILIMSINKIKEEKKETKIIEETKEIVQFNDQNLINKIKESNNFEDNITISKAEQIEKLDLSSSNIKDLTGLENFINLTELNLSNNQIESIKPLNKLTKLKQLNISKNYVKNIKYLRNLNELAYPIINNNPIMDYTLLIDKVNIYSSNYEKQKNISQEEIDNKKDQFIEYVKNEQQGVQKAKSIINNIINTDMDDLEKEYKIINYIKENIEYIETNNNYILYDALINNKGNYNNYSYAFNYLATIAQLENYIIESNNYKWNLIKINDKYYELDITKLIKESNYEYINTSKEKMSGLHHYSSNNNLPVAEETLNIEEQKQYQKQD